MATIIDLPTELLLEVIAHLDPGDSISCISLALTCRRFYDVLIPRIHVEQIQQFSQLLETPRLRITERIEMPVKATSNEDLMFQSVIANPFRESIGKLRFVVGGSEKELQSVLGVISRANNLEGVHLELGYSCSQRRVARAINVCVAKPDLGLTVRGGIPDFRRGLFKYEINSNTKPLPPLPLVNLKVAKTTKNSLFKSFLAVFTKPFSKPSQSQVSQVPINKAGEDGPASSESSVSAVLVEPKFRFARLPHPQLSSISIQTDALFLPSLYPVTLNALNHSPIHTLSISDVKLTLYDWSHILPSITMPMLKCFSISDGVSIAFPDLLAFLTGHPSIETLDFTSNDVIGFVHFPKKSTILLPHLTSLTANSEYLIPFAQHKKAGYFPCLTNLHINGPKHDLDVLYDLISEGGFWDLSLALDVMPSVALIEWILSENLKGGSSSKRQHQLVGVHSLVMFMDPETEPFLANRTRGQLKKWAVDNASLVEEFEIKRRDSSKSPLEKYLRITEAVVWSAAPQLKELVHRFA